MTKTRNKIDFTQAMKHLLELYASAEVIRVVLDNLNMHKIASLYEALPPKEVRALAKKLEFHYTPKHGSWLNMAEIEFAVLSNMYLKKQRVEDEDSLRRVVQANVAERNRLAQPLKWRFTTRIQHHRIFRGLVVRGKSSMGWFDGFKIHFTLNHRGELLNIKLTPGKVNDRKPVSS